MIPRNHLLGFSLQLERLHSAVPTHLLSWCQRAGSRTRLTLATVGSGQLVQVYTWWASLHFRVPSPCRLLPFSVSHLGFLSCSRTATPGFPRRGTGLSPFPPSTCGNRTTSFNILQYCPWPVGGKQRNPGNPFKDGLWHFSAEAIFTGYKLVLETFHFRDSTLVGSAGMYGSLFSLLTLCILVAYEEESTENGLFNLKRFKVLQVGWRPERTP